jgi:hypothetical protein
MDGSIHERKIFSRHLLLVIQTVEPNNIRSSKTKFCTSSYSGFVVSKTKKIQRLSKIFAAYFQRLFKNV